METNHYSEQGVKEPDVIEIISLLRERLVRAVDLRRIHKMRFASKK